jgi:tripartite-type tricarboxylate transporter receptor subunit TctC
MFTKRAFLSAIAGLGATMVIPARARAQSYPQRPIKMVVPGSPGGPVDVLSRLAAHGLQSMLGQSVIIENNAGAGGLLAARAVARAVPDGYTLLFGNTATLANIPAISKSAGYDSAKNFAGVAKVMDSYQVLVVSPNLPVKSVAELTAYAKANPGKLNYGAAGPINLTNLAGELYKLKDGLDFVAVHFKSGAESITCVVSDQCQLTIDNVTAVRALMEDGKLCPLAVTSARRQSDFPDLPTMIEAGVPDYVVTSFFGVVAPAGTPAPVIARLNAVINEALRTEPVQAALKKLGAEPTVESPEEFTRFIAAEMRKWTEIAAIAGIKAD